MRFVSLFAGVGGFDLGFEQAGWECVGQVEIDKHARAVLDKHWPDVPKHDDVTTAKEWADGIGLRGRVDVVCGGFPCQPFSVAGKRLGRDDLRGNLFWNALSFATHVEAGIVVMENVPGLLTADSGRTFGDIVASLADAGYGHVEWRVLDSQFFGVPQRRRRVFIVAGRDSSVFGGRSVLTQPEGVRWNPPSIGEAGQDTAPGVEAGTGDGGWTPRIVATLNSGGNAGGFRTEPGEHVVVRPAGLFSMTQYGGYTEGMGTMSATDYKRPEHHVVVEQ